MENNQKSLGGFLGDFVYLNGPITLLSLETMLDGCLLAEAVSTEFLGQACEVAGDAGVGGAIGDFEVGHDGRCDDGQLNVTIRREKSTEYGQSVMIRYVEAAPDGGWEQVEIGGDPQ